MKTTVRTILVAGACVALMGVAACHKKDNASEAAASASAAAADASPAASDASAAASSAMAAAASEAPASSAAPAQ